MKLTNKLNLPQPLVNAARNDDYSRGAARVSVTQLIDSPRVRILREKYHGEMVEDVSNRLWAIVGTAIHKLMEAKADGIEHLPEERLFAEVGGWVISGGIDVQVTGDDWSLIDWKFTSAWAVMADKPDWERQLNTYAYLVRVSKGKRITKLRIGALIRDWQRRDAANKPDYPQAPIQMVDVELWSDEEQERYVKERVLLHQRAQAAAEFEDEPAHCSEDERWLRNKKFAVMKPGAKRATRICDTHEEAVSTAQSMESAFIEERGGEPIRCVNNFCGVADFCSQFKEGK